MRSSEKWTYKVLKLKVKTFANAENQAAHIEDQLNQVGMVGWELVNVVLVGTSLQAFFKR